MMPRTTSRTHRAAVTVLMVGLFGVTAGCATNGAAERSVPRACTTELQGFAAYTGENCRTCENVHVAAPGEPRRCGLEGLRPGSDMGGQGEPAEENNDRDNDGVADRNDVCPDSPVGVDVLANGCERLELEGVVFALDSANLRPGARQALEDQLDVLRRGAVRVEIGGHTDAQGPADYNRDLSERRARTVRNFFVDHGIDPERLTVEGYGESEPLAPNDSASGRERNRRVELRVLGRQ